MEDTIRKKLIELGVKAGDTVGVAVSGGVDSMVLLNCLCELRGKMEIRIIACHMEHGIRGQQSKKDMDFVIEQCEKLGIECITERVDVPAIAESAGLSVETAARQVRYEFLDRQGADFIATAHHMDDMAETVIMNLVRGSGLSGLCGIPEARGRYIRPMLGISRSEIEEYAKKNKTDYVNDETNDDTAYTRNYIRKEIIPRFKVINEAAVANILRTTRLLAEDEEALRFAARSAGCIEEKDDGVYIDLEIFSRQQTAVKKRIVRLAIEKICGLEDVENVNIQDVLKLAQQSRTAKRIDIGKGVFAAIVYNKLMIGKKSARGYNYNSVTLHEGRISFAGFEFECAEYNEEPQFGKGVEYFDSEVIDGAQFRYRREGDFIVPLGMCGNKRLCDYLSDRKVPLHKRDSLALLAKENEVFWVVGVGVSEVSKVEQKGRSLQVRYWRKGNA